MKTRVSDASLRLDLVLDLLILASYPLILFVLNIVYGNS